MGNKKSLVNLAIFLLEIAIAVGGLTLLRLGLVDSGLNDILLIGVGLFFFSFGLSWLVIRLRYIYLPRSYTHDSPPEFLGTGFLLLVICLVSISIINIDTGQKY